MIYRVASSVLVVGFGYSIEVGHVNIGCHAFALSALAIVIIVEVVYLVVGSLLGRVLVLRLLLRRWHLRHWRPLLGLSRWPVPCSASGRWSGWYVCR
jgi:hypothetical protein